MNNDQKRTAIAFTLSIVVLFAWQTFFSPKKDLVAPVTTEVSSSATTSVTDNLNKPVNVAIAAPALAVVKTTSREIILEDYKFEITSDFTIVNAVGYKGHMTFRDFTDADKPFQVLAVTGANVLTPFNFIFDSQISSNTLTGFDEKLNAKISFILDKDGKLSYNLQLNNPSKLVFKVVSKEKQSSNRTYRQFVLYEKEVTRINVESDEAADGKFRWYALDFQHHILANVFPNTLNANYKTTETGELYLQTFDSFKSFEGYFLYSLKNYDFLASFNDKLDLSIDFGLFGIISVPILRSLQYIYKFVGNYGLAIIILTFLIRFLTYPLQRKSFKSMKKMQVVQPEIAKIKEKYKDDPARVQRETMELFKKAGANPLGGCLPMLLQVPIFIAFYQAINNSVELVGSPFILWIYDLSAKDPYYVLPVLMGITMLAQTKLNPSTSTDPNQKKIMYIMPLVFSFIMKDLPSGLNLYFFVSNLLGIAQQLYVYKSVED